MSISMKMDKFLKSVSEREMERGIYLFQREKWRERGIETSILREDH